MRPIAQILMARYGVVLWMNVRAVVSALILQNSQITMRISAQSGEEKGNNSCFTMITTVLYRAAPYSRQFYLEKNIVLSIDPTRLH